MKIVLFITVVLSVVFGINSYLFIRGWQAFPPNIWIRISYILVFVISIASFFLRMYYGDKLPERVSITFSAIGFTWIVAVFYLSLFALSIDIIRIANHFLHFLPQYIYSNYQFVKLVLAITGMAIVSLTLFIGNHRFNNPVVQKLDISFEGHSQNKEIKIVMASDMHLSSYINRENLKKYVTLINNQNPDLVLFGGDITDRNIEPLIKGKMAEIFATIKSRYGVYTISGNHEFYNGDRTQIIDYLQSAGIVFLKDTAVLSVDSSLYIIGRDDRTNTKRAPLGDLMAGLKSDLPKILLDHQPVHLEEAQQKGVDLQLSGHTHNGQFWPGSLVVKRMFELPYGYMKKGKTHYYTSSGIGIWGPKYRIGTVSEIVVIDLKY